MTCEDDQSDGNGKTGIVLLAAGASSRMGAPKQLLKVKGISLIRRAAEQALDSGCQPVVVVLGANADLIAPELDGLTIDIAVNRDWKMGMSSSILCGLKSLLCANPTLESVILFLADQPNITATSLRRLTTAHVQSGSQLVAAAYSGPIGTPALFSRIHFNELLQIEGQGGAKSLLERHAPCVLPIEFPEAACDLDTPEDVADFVEGNELELQAKPNVRQAVG